MARQRDSDKVIRNDRLLGAPVTEVNPPAFEHINQIDETRLAEIEHFFVYITRRTAESLCRADVGALAKPSRRFAWHTTLPSCNLGVDKLPQAGLCSRC